MFLIIINYINLSQSVASSSNWHRSVLYLATKQKTPKSIDS